jgi:DUF971 family protein
VHEPTSIELKDGKVLVITWDDGRVDQMTAIDLRISCPCASCGTSTIPLVPALMANTHIQDVQFVGAYAINLKFSPDGHATGIFSYPLLREIGEDVRTS